jgi:hypothetical protein
MEYQITDFDHSQGTYVVLYNDGVYLNMSAARKDGVWSTGQDLENSIQWRHPSVRADHRDDLEPFFVEDKPNMDLPEEIVQKAALYQPQIL